jgi:hypothetical protein
MRREQRYAVLLQQVALQECYRQILLPLVVFSLYIYLAAVHNIHWLKVWPGVCVLCRYVRSRIGQALKLRLTPEVRFEHDDSLDELEKVGGVTTACCQYEVAAAVARVQQQQRHVCSSSSSSRRSCISLSACHALYLDLLAPLHESASAITMVAQLLARLNAFPLTLICCLAYPDVYCLCTAGDCRFKRQSARKTSTGTLQRQKQRHVAPQLAAAAAAAVQPPPTVTRSTRVLMMKKVMMTAASLTCLKAMHQQKLHLQQQQQLG